MRIAYLLTFIILSLGSGTSQGQDDEFSFDSEDFSKSSWMVDGFLQANLDYLALNSESPFYRLAFLDKKDDKHRFPGGAELQLGLSYQQHSLTSYWLGKLEQSYNGYDWESNPLLYEGRVAWQVNPNMFVTAGKILPRWGKGYAWNPTNFVGRLKNPSDPDLSLEGHWAGQLDFVKSFQGALKNIALTALVLPVSEAINIGFGEYDHVNVAGKLYLLFHDTDIDFMALSSGSKSARYGFTVSRNLTANFEIHGEAALFSDHKKILVKDDGTILNTTSDVQSYLAGIRYLSSTNTTYVVEYYFNGQGYSRKESEEMFGHLAALDDRQLATIATNLAGYQIPNYMKNYFYLKASQKEPFGWLYLTPSLYPNYANFWLSSYC